MHDAGYNILAYDIRNHGMSGQGNGGIVGITGLLEYRDVIGSLRYAKTSAGHQGYEEGPAVGVPGRGLDRRGVVEAPAEFDEIQAMVMLQPVSANYTSSRSS